MAVNDINNRDTTLKTQFLDDGLVSADGTALKDLDITYTEADDVNAFLNGTTGLSANISGATKYNNRTKDSITAALKGSEGEDGIIDIILSAEGFTGDSKIPDEIKDLLIGEATSFGTVNGKPKDVTEIIQNLLQILERYDSDSDKNFGDVAHDDTVSDDTALRRYFSDSNFKSSDNQNFQNVNFVYTKADKTAISEILNNDDLTLDTPYNKTNHKDAIYSSIDEMTDSFKIDPAMKDKLIAEAASLKDSTGGTLTIGDLLNNVARVLERYDNANDQDFGNIDNDDGVVDDKGVAKDRDSFLKNKLSDRNLKDSKGNSFSSSNFVYTTKGAGNDKSEIETLLKDSTSEGFNLPNGTSTVYNPKAHTKAVNASIDKMTDGFTLDPATKAQLIAEATSLGNPGGGQFTISELLDNIAKVLERYDNNKTDKNVGDVDKDSQVDANLQTGFAALKGKDGKTFSAVEYDFVTAADTAITGSNQTTLSQEYNSTTNKNSLEAEITKMFTDAGITTVPPALLENIIKEASTLGDATGDKLTIGDMLKNAAKVIERYDNNTIDKNYGDVTRNSSFKDDDEALKQYFANFTDSKNVIFSNTNFAYEATDKDKIENLSTKWGLNTTYNQNTHQQAIYQSIDEMTDEFGSKIDPAIKDKLIAEALSLGDANGNKFTIGDLLDNIAKVLERYDNDKNYGSRPKDQTLGRDKALEKTFTSSGLTDNKGTAFSDTNFAYDANNIGLTVAQSTQNYAYNDSTLQQKQITALKDAIDTMFGEFQLDDATKDQLIAEALSFDPLKKITLSKILDNISQIVERYDSDKADNNKAAEDVGDVAHDSVAQEEIKEALKDVDFNKNQTSSINNDEYIGLEENYNDYIEQHTIILNSIDNMVTQAVTLSPDVKELLIAQAAAMTDPTADGTFTVGDLLANIKILLEKSDNDNSATKVTFASPFNYNTDV